MLVKCFHCGVNADHSIKRVDSVERDVLIVLFECDSCKREFAAGFKFESYHAPETFKCERYVKTSEKEIPLKEFAGMLNPKSRG